PTSTSRPLDRASRTRRCSAGSRTACARRESTDRGRLLGRRVPERLPVDGALGRGLLRILAETFGTAGSRHNIEVPVGVHPDGRIGFAANAIGHVHGARAAELWRVLLGVGLEQVAVACIGKPIAYAVKDVLVFGHARRGRGEREIGDGVIALQADTLGPGG